MALEHSGVQSAGEWEPQRYRRHLSAGKNVDTRNLLPPPKESGVARGGAGGASWLAVLEYHLLGGGGGAEMPQMPVKSHTAKRVWADS